MQVLSSVSTTLAYNLGDRVAVCQKPPLGSWLIGTVTKAHDGSHEGLKLQLDVGKSFVVKAINRVFVLPKDTPHPITQDIIVNPMFTPGKLQWGHRKEDIIVLPKKGGKAPPTAKVGFVKSEAPTVQEAVKAIKSPTPPKQPKPVLAPKPVAVIAPAKEAAPTPPKPPIEGGRGAGKPTSEHHIVTKTVSKPVEIVDKQTRLIYGTPLTIGKLYSDGSKVYEIEAFNTDGSILVYDAGDGALHKNIHPKEAQPLEPYKEIPKTNTFNVLGGSNSTATLGNGRVFSATENSYYVNPLTGDHLRFSFAEKKSNKFFFQRLYKGSYTSSVRGFRPEIVAHFLPDNIRNKWTEVDEDDDVTDVKIKGDTGIAAQKNPNEQTVQIAPMSVKDAVIKSIRGVRGKFMINEHEFSTKAKYRHAKSGEVYILGSGETQTQQVRLENPENPAKVIFVTPDDFLNNYVPHIVKNPAIELGDGVWNINNKIYDTKSLYMRSNPALDDDENNPPLRLVSVSTENNKLFGTFVNEDAMSVAVTPGDKIKAKRLIKFSEFDTLIPFVRKGIKTQYQRLLEGNLATGVKPSVNSHKLDWKGKLKAAGHDVSVTPHSFTEEDFAKYAEKYKTEDAAPHAPYGYNAGDDAEEGFVSKEHRVFKQLRQRAAYDEDRVKLGVNQPPARIGNGNASGNPSNHSAMRVIKTTPRMVKDVYTGKLREYIESTDGPYDIPDFQQVAVGDYSDEDLKKLLKTAARKGYKVGDRMAIEGYDQTDALVDKAVGTITKVNTEGLYYELVSDDGTPFKYGFNQAYSPGKTPDRFFHTTNKPKNPDRKTPKQYERAVGRDTRIIANPSGVAPTDFLQLPKREKFELPKHKIEDMKDGAGWFVNGNPLYKHKFYSYLHDSMGERIYMPIIVEANGNILVQDTDSQQVDIIYPSELPLKAYTGPLLKQLTKKYVNKK